jgi:hypothetical protein
MDRYLDEMRVPSQQPPLASVYLNLLQARNPRLPQSGDPSDAASLGRPTTIESGTAPTGARLPRGSLIDIKA